MEQNFVKNAISNYFSIRTDIFGEGSTYEGFQEIKTSPSTADGFNSTLLFGQIVYKDGQGTVHKSTPIILKLTPKLKNSRYISNSFINEMNFYTKVIPTLSKLDESFPSLFPKYHHGEMIFNIEDHSVIIFEDLKAKGYQLAKKKAFLDRNHLILMLRKLGQFHAYSYKAKNDIPNLFYPLVNQCLEANAYVNLEFSNFLSIAGQPGFKHLLQTNPAYEKYAPSIANMLQNGEELYIKAISGDKDDPTSVICHGDFLRNNVMFKYENDVPKDLIFIDLATFRFASPVIDLLTVLYFNTDQATRDELWDTLIDEYYTALKTTFPESPVPEKSEILSQFVGRAFYAYLVSTYFLPHLINCDNEVNEPLSEYEQVFSPDKRDLGLYQMPVDFLVKVVLAAGSEAGTQAMSDILKDIIDRGFICT